MKRLFKILLFSYIVTFTTSKIYSQEKSDSSLNTTDLIIVGEKDSQIDGKIASELDSIRLDLTNKKDFDIENFEILLYNGDGFLKSYNNKGNHMRNVYADYISKDSVLGVDLDHAIFKVKIINKNNYLKKSITKIVYFSYVVRTQCH